MQDKKETSVDDESSKILELARARFDLAVDAESSLRTLALEDLKFGAGEQWDPADKAQRQLERRPCLTINRLPQFIRQIVNDQRQNRPAIKVSPVDDKADPETAKVFQGIIRHIEQSSNAELAYDTAFDSAVRTGFGYFRIRTAYSDPQSFDQDILIEPIKNRFSVYLDPAHLLPDASDAKWGFIFEDMPKDEFLAAYPDADLSAMADWSSIGDQRKGWATKDSVRVAEYFYIENREATLLKLSDGSSVIKEELEHTPLEIEDYDESGRPVTSTVHEPILPEGVGVIDERTTQIPTVKWCKHNGFKILEQTEWLGRWIPIIPVLGEEIDIEGKKTLEGVIRHAKDSQRMYNYWKSAETETIALAPKAPWLVAGGQIEGYEKFWNTANTRAHSYLPYKPTDLNGMPVPPPQRNAFEPPIQAITQAGMMAADDMKSTTGIYDAGLGAQSNEKSGIAIQRRNQQAQTSNFHFVDNLSRAIRHCGRQLVDLIPKIMDVPRAQRILGEDGTEEIVWLNKMFERNAKQVQINLGIGKYDVVVTTGPSYATKRQEAASSMLEMAKTAPQVMGAAGDLIVKAMDWPGAEEVAERLKKTLPPGMADDPKKNPIPPQAQAQIQQMNQMIEQLTEQLKHKTEQINTKAIELESKERIEMQKLQVELQIAMAKIDATDSLAVFQAEMAQLEGRLNLLHQNLPVGAASQDSAPPPQPQPGMNGPGPVQPAPHQITQQPTGGSSPGEFVE